MSEHVFDDLPQLLSGEAERDTVMAVAAHLRSCEDCRNELVSALVAHAVLMSAVRFAPDLRLTPKFDEATVGSWTESGPHHETTLPAESSALAELPDLSGLFAQIRAEKAESASESAPEAVDELSTRRAARSGGRRYAWIAAAAIVVLGVGGGGVALAKNGPSSSPATRSVALDAYDEGSMPATAQLVGKDTIKLNAAALPVLETGRYYEVWLTNSTRTAMAPVGQLDSGGKGTFRVPVSEVANYGAIEVSVQSTQNAGAYSGVSVLRGSYA